MGVAAINAVVLFVTAVWHFCQRHETALALLAFYAVLKAPEKIPFTPQAFWTWGRDTGQAIAETRTPPPHPTQPAPIVPEQTKPTT